VRLFSYPSPFSCVTDNMEVFLTLAERQYIVKYELDGLRAQRDLRVPGLADNYTLQYRDNVCECSPMPVWKSPSSGRKTFFFTGRSSVFQLVA